MEGWTMGIWILLAWLVLAAFIVAGGSYLARRRPRGQLDASFEDLIPSMEPWDDEPAIDPQG
jgi:hypothetical protein